MPVRVTCPSCKAVHTLAEDVLGKAMRCPQCQQLFRVAAPPKPPVLPEEPLEVLPADAPALPSAAKEGVQAQPGKVPPTPPPLRPAAHPDRSARTRPDERVRPQPQRNAAGGNRTLILVLVGVAAVLLLGCAGVVVGGILYFRTSVAAVTQRGPVVQAEGRAPDAGVRGPMAPFERERPVVPPVNPPVQVAL